jgi:hypothetical protein
MFATVIALTPEDLEACVYITTGQVSLLLYQHIWIYTYMCVCMANNILLIGVYV